MWSTWPDVTAADDIPGPALALLVEHVNTLEKLELLATVMGAPHATWSLDAVCDELRIPASQLRPQIDQLRACGLLRLVPGRPFRLRYQPQTRELADAAAAVLAVYQRDRGALVKVLRTIDLLRARRAPAEELASAFVVRRLIEEEGDE
jgi:hypothetical protein